MAKYTRYIHHGKEVWVQDDLKGQHRENCLCYKCKKYTPDDRENCCPIANALYRFAVLTDIVCPVWECKQFEANA